MYRGDFFTIQISKTAVRCPYAGMFIVMYSDIVPVRLEEDGIIKRKRKKKKKSQLNTSKKKRMKKKLGTGFFSFNIQFVSKNQEKTNNITYKFAIVPAPFAIKPV